MAMNQASTLGTALRRLALRSGFRRSWLVSISRSSATWTRQPHHWSAVATGAFLPHIRSATE
eukprot:12654547-Heterocapsa_arctica.AAC.1